MKKTLVNGKASDSISVYDRGFLYGHGLFETIAVQNKRPLLLDAHLQRLAADANKLGISAPIEQIKQDIETLSVSTELGVIRVTLTCGEGSRGYVTPDNAQSNRIVSLFDWPSHIGGYHDSGIHLGITEYKLAQQPLLAGIKHLNRLEQVLIRQQWQNGWQEAIVCDEQGNAIEATQSNLFIVSADGILLTPDVNKCGINGVMRNTVIQYAAKIGIELVEKTIPLTEIHNAQEIFVTNSIIGVWPVRYFENKNYTNRPISQTLLEELIKNDAIAKN